MKNEFSFKGMTAQKKLILQGVIISTILIAFIASLAVFNIEKHLNIGYKNFGQILSKTLAIESVDLTKDIEQNEIAQTLKIHSDSILRSNSDIAFIEFRDAASKVIYSSKEYYYSQAQNTKISVSSPMIVKGVDGTKIVGSVMVGLSGSIIENISNTTRASLVMAFIIAWLAVIAIVFMDTVLITRELKQLQKGVQKISSGEFGYNIECNDSSREVIELCDAFNKMSNRLSKYNEQTMENITLERNKLEAVLMSIANGVVVCDNHDTVVLINEQGKKLLEVEDNDIINSKIHQYCDTRGELCFKEKIDLFKNTPLDDMESEPLSFNIEVAKNIIKSIISPMFSRNGDYVGYIIVLIDVTKEVEMEQLRAHFISNVSHELRTPVTVLRSYIDTLYNYGNDFDYNTQKEFIGVMNQEIIRLNTMVNDILDFSRYESNNIKPEMTNENFVNILDTCINQVKVLAEEHDLIFSVMVEPDLPQVTLNKESITRALTNIISNAIKYSPDGKRIKIRAERSRIGDYLEVSVEDQGAGIAEEYQNKVFDRFFRVENDTHSVKGTGLGLHLVKIAVEKHHNGQVFVQSKVGEGSTFGFRIPFVSIADEQEEYIPKVHIEDNNEFQEQSQSADDNWEFTLEKN